MPYYPKAIINAKFSPESNLPVTDKSPFTWTLPVKVAAPLASIVRRLDPPVTKAISSEAGDIKPVFGSPVNFKAQLLVVPLSNPEFVPSCRNNGNPPFVRAS